MLAHSAAFVRPRLPPPGGEVRTDVADALTRLGGHANPLPDERPCGDSISGEHAVDSSPPSSVQLGASRKLQTLDDAALVHATRAGDPRAADAIWTRYAPLVRSKLGRSVGTQDVEDQVQEVFLRLFEYLGQLRDPSALRSFLIGITLRIAGTELRRRRCRWWLTLTATGELPEPAAFEDAETRLVVRRLFDILGKLTPESGRIFELRYVEGKELAEVAAAMHVSLATAKRYLARIWARVEAMAEREPLLAGYLRANVEAA
jgi:RNA polymerase sigma-70 factor (ECF subfamily)